MIPNNQWKLDMVEGVTAMAGVIDSDEIRRLRNSIREPIDHQRMQADTQERTGGACPIRRRYLQRQYKQLAEACVKCWNPKPKTETE